MSTDSTEHLNPFHGAHATSSRRGANIDETYARYERSLFQRNLPKLSQEDQDIVARQKSGKRLINRFSSIRCTMGRGKLGGSNRMSQGPKPDYSLAGPSDCRWQANDHDVEYNSDEGFGDYGRRPQAIIGLSKPFPRRKRGDRWGKPDIKYQYQHGKGDSEIAEKSESGVPEGQVSVEDLLILLKILLC
jgi:hypothetical protein